MPDDELMSYEPTRALLGIPKGTLRALVCQRRIPHIRISCRLVRFRRSEIEAWLASHAVEAANDVGTALRKVK